VFRNRRKEWCPQGNSNPNNIAKLLNKTSVTQLAELSNFSKAYISQVKHGRRPPSKKLILALTQIYNSGNNSESKETTITIELFLESRQNGISPSTITFYRKYLKKAIPAIGLTPTPRQLNSYINSLHCSAGGKHAYYRAISEFYN
jgi:transcriptional regulator with XRE-family HTH domain